jgi:hypothetical protein
MNEFLQAINAPQNALLTGLLFLVVLYWGAVIILGLGIELMDGLFSFLDFGGHDLDPTTSLDTHLDAGHTNAPFFVTAFRFFNFGEVPVTIILSAFIISAWMGSVGLHGWYSPFHPLLQAGVVLGIIVGALLVTKLVTTPLKSVFSSKYDKGPERTNLIGCDCILTMSVSETQSGQAEAKTPDNRFLVVSVRANPGQGNIPKGARAVIVSVDPNAGGFLVRLPGSSSEPSVGGNKK